ncbi:MAG: hypothetical protein ACRCSM_06285 [Sediminibacterium sp.]|jgi:hypothetical protein|nr:hypothetical protein [Chitinophagaceae bacterium]MCA6446621.1 hypothetical protein [Chitinophagaceae bacterium]
MKTLTAIFITILLFGCREKRNTVPTPLQSKPAPSIKLADTLRDFSTINFFAVYKLSPKTMAIVIPLHDKDVAPPTIFDTLVNQLKFPEPGSLMPIGSSYVDTSGLYKILKVDSLSERVKQHIAPAYFVCGTKGAAKVTINEVLLALDECKTNFIALTISSFDTTHYGMPILCSDKLLKIEYNGNFADVEKQIVQLEGEQKGIMTTCLKFQQKFSGMPVLCSSPTATTFFGRESRESRNAFFLPGTFLSKKKMDL